LEVRQCEGGMCDLPVERLAPGALSRRLCRAEPLADAPATETTNKNLNARGGACRNWSTFVDLLRLHFVWDEEILTNC
jgi:hypothetical protein